MTTLSSSNFQEICRTCLYTKSQTEALDDSNKLFSLYEHAMGDAKDYKIIELLGETVRGLEIHSMDELPKNICEKCINNLVNFYHFQVQCLKSQNILLDIIGRENFVEIKTDDNDPSERMNENQIKIEVCEEEIHEQEFLDERNSELEMNDLHPGSLLEEFNNHEATSSNSLKAVKSMESGRNPSKELNPERVDTMAAEWSLSYEELYQEEINQRKKDDIRHCEVLKNEIEQVDQAIPSSNSPNLRRQRSYETVKQNISNETALSGTECVHMHQLLHPKIEEIDEAIPSSNSHNLSRQRSYETVNQNISKQTAFTGTECVRVHQLLHPKIEEIDEAIPRQRSYETVKQNSCTEISLTDSECFRFNQQQHPKIAQVDQAKPTPNSCNLRRQRYYETLQQNIFKETPLTGSECDDLNQQQHPEFEEFNEASPSSHSCNLRRQRYFETLKQNITRATPLTSAERVRLYRQRRRKVKEVDQATPSANSRKLRRERYSERHKEETIKQAISKTTPLTSAERTRLYRQRHREEVNQKRREKYRLLKEKKLQTSFC